MTYKSADEHGSDILSQGAWQGEDEVEEHADHVYGLSTDHFRDWTDAERGELMPVMNLLVHLRGAKRSGPTPKPTTNRVMLR